MTFVVFVLYLLYKQQNMKTLLISGNTLTEWDIEEVLKVESLHSPKDIYGEIMFEKKRYSEERREIYDLFQLTNR